MNNQDIALMLEIIKNGSYLGTTIDAVQDLKTKLKGMIVEETKAN